MLVARHIVHGDKDPLMAWQKTTLHNIMNGHPEVMVHFDKRVKAEKVRNVFVSHVKLKPVWIYVV